MESKAGRQRETPFDSITNSWGLGMVSVSDILKLLDQIPIWKTVSTLPKRVAELERQVAELQKNMMAAPSGRECPICGSIMKVVAEYPHPHFAFAGIKIHKMECQNSECAHKTERDFEPGKGYK
jgi:hypothetical protein